MGLNDILLKFVNENEIYDISYFSPVSSMSRIILESRVPSFHDKIKNRFGLSNSFIIAYEFFNYLGSEYANYFVDRTNSRDIILQYFKKNNQTAFSFLDDFGEKKDIFAVWKGYL